MIFISSGFACKKHKDSCFRNLYAFNLAVLVKQGWRILQYPESLTARLFKAKYFSHTSFWEAPIPSSSSYCWSSILKARLVLEKGSRWLIGDGGVSTGMEGSVGT